jgi:hypothetical protein
MSSLQTTIVRPGGTTTKLTGEVVYLYAFDVAYELRHYPHAELLGHPVIQFAVDSSKRTPKQLFFHRPQMVRFPPMEKLTPEGLVQLRWVVKLLPVGALSVSVHLPFEVDSIEDLIGYHDLRFSDGRSIHDEARAVAEQVRQAIKPYLIRPQQGLTDEEAYTVFFLNSPKPDSSADEDVVEFDAQRFLKLHRRSIANLLAEERDTTLLSDQECDESTNNWFSYSRRDLAVFDWDAALVIDDPSQFDQTLYVIELANLQLTELEAYDRILDNVVDGAYADLAARGVGRWFAGSMQRELRVIRVDLARLTDELGNLSKFFGDFHAARLYQGLALRFHLAEWQKSIDHKLLTLDHVYQLLASDRMNRWMIVLEAMIVLLFVFDIVKSMVVPAIAG